MKHSRHSFAFHLVEAGTDLYTVMRLLGHADLRDTELYIHLSKRHLQAVVNPLDALQLQLAAGTEEPDPQ
jgi:site-specific recombinase XerD